MTAKIQMKTSHKGRIYRSFLSRHNKAWFVGALVLCFMLPSAVSGLTTISQGYSTSAALSQGSIVSLQANSSDHVEATTINNVNSMLGVVISDGNSLLSLSSDQANQTQVATSGIAQVLVSDINGVVSQGDQITASPVSGVGMKATNNAKVIGVAQEGFSSNDGSTQTYTDKSGAKHTMILKPIPVLVNVSYYYKQPDKTFVPPAIQNLANALAGKTVNALPVLISMGIFIVTLIVVVSIVYSMIHSSIISVGRNPMSQSAIYRDLVQLSALVVGILVVAVISIYMILTRF